MTFIGLDGWSYLNAPLDRVDRLIAEHLIDRVAELRAQERDSLAIAIVNTLGKAMG